MSAQTVDVTGVGVLLTDGSPDEVTFDLPVELRFRRFHEGADLASYFGKFRPLFGS